MVSMRRGATVPQQQGSQFPWKLLAIAMGVLLLAILIAVVGVTQIGGTDRGKTSIPENNLQPDSEHPWNSLGIPSANVQQEGSSTFGFELDRALIQKGSAADVQNGEPREVVVMSRSVAGKTYWSTGGTDKPADPSYAMDNVYAGMSFVLWANAGHVDTAMKFVKTDDPAARERILQAALDLFYATPSLEGYALANWSAEEPSNSRLDTSYLAAEGLKPPFFFNYDLIVEKEGSGEIVSIPSGSGWVEAEVATWRVVDVISDPKPY